MNGRLDVEVHNGQVIAVWFNCQLLPYQQWDVDEDRAAQSGGNPDAVIVDRIAVEYQEPAQ